MLAGYILVNVQMLLTGLNKRSPTRNAVYKLNWEAKWGGTCIFSHGSTSSAGVTILFGNTIDYTIRN